MTKHIILSVNNNPEYMFYTPLTCYLWKKFGWEPVVFWQGEVRAMQCYVSARPQMIGVKEYVVNDLKGHKSETITQISRLFGSCVVDGYIMTGDIDMIPLSDYWRPDFNELTVWGRDLTDYHYPICYIGAPAQTWRNVMGIVGDDYNKLIERDLNNCKPRGSIWCLDQDIITERINLQYSPVRVDRGTDKRTGYPIGRVDRSHWTLNHKQFIDCHMFRGIYKDAGTFGYTMELLTKLFPDDDWSWFVEYRNTFKKLVNE